MEVTTKDLYDWLERHYHDYEVSADPLEGTYGLIWFLSGKSGNSGSFAVKTLAPERLAVAKTRIDAEYLRREFRIWLALPHTYNVLPALGFDIATLCSDESENSVQLPVMRMPRRLGTLKDWINSEDYSYEDRLVALAQAFNGLLYLYEHDIQGHGDLKPSNILYDDLQSIALPEDGAWPSRSCPWRIQVADLGWADAWVDLGFTNKAERQYRAPERLGADGKVIPALSDVFSMGIIAAEVIQGRPPNNPKIPKTSDGKWQRWIEGAEWDLSGVESPRLEKFILQCLSLNAIDRPSPLDCLDEICSEIEHKYGYSIMETLKSWRMPAAGVSSIAADEHIAWAAPESVKLGEQQTSKSKEHLKGRLNQLEVVNFETCERWIVLAKGLEKLLNTDATDGDALAELRKKANLFLVNILGPMTPSDLIKVPPREDWPNLIIPFERFSEVTTEIAHLAGVNFKQAQKPQFGLGDYALSAIAFGAASEARCLPSSAEEESRYLADAIRFSPLEAALYYFRARWGSERALIRRVLSKEIISEDERQSWVVDLEMALACDPNWKEAVQLLKRIRTDQP